MLSRTTTAVLTVNSEPVICKRYAAELKAIADLDREYYQNPSPNAVERVNYYKRQEDLERTRHRLHSELCASHQMPRERFRLSLTDHALHKTITSSAQCLLRHDLNNYLGVVIGRCGLLAELLPTESSEARHLTVVVEMARKMISRLAGDACSI